jgi:hypothetical protein
MTASNDSWEQSTRPRPWNAISFYFRPARASTARYGPEPPRAGDRSPARLYYGRRNRPGVCVFIDGAVHNQPELAAHDRQVRDDLEDRGFRVVTIAGSNFAGGWRPMRMSLACPRRHPEHHR